MSVKIGSARIDENGHATGGAAGDQTGKEVSTQAWYKHSKGWRVFRPKSAEAAERIAFCMQAACDNGHIGYDQNQRGTLYSVSKGLGFDCRKVTTKCETDCSALVRVCCAYAGIQLPDFNTASEAAALLASGAFVELVGSKYTDSSAYLKRGDILVTRSKGHTAVVLTDGEKAEAAAAPVIAEGIESPCVVAIGSVYVRTGPSTDYGYMGILGAGNRLHYFGYTAPNGWHLVEFGGATGWVSGKFAEVRG